MTILRNILGCIIGLILGSAVNMALITWGPSVIPPPAGVDVTSTESLSQSMHLFEAKHFIFPFLAHALGTLVGALAAFFIAASQKVSVAFVVGGLFLLGGIAASFMIPAPVWFIVLDLVAAYIPMAWIAGRIGTSITPISNRA